MEISTLKELKDRLSKVPDDVLEQFGFGLCEDNDDRVHLLCWGDKAEEGWGLYGDKYPQLTKLDNLIGNIISINEKLEKQDDNSIWESDSPISSKKAKAERRHSPQH